MSEAPFETIMAANDPALVVVTTAAEGERAGCLVGFHAQSSIDPERYCLWVSKANHTYRVSLRARHFVMHFLTDQDFELAKRFGTLTGDTVDKFEGLRLDIDAHGVPVLLDCPNRFSLERLALLDDGGDHVCLTARVSNASTRGPFAPLRVTHAGELDPGHGSDERAIDLNS